MISIHWRLKVAVPDALAVQGVVDMPTIFPPVSAKFPLAVSLFGGTVIVNIAVLPFSDNINVRVRLAPAAPVTTALAAAMLSKQLLPVVKFRLEMLTEAVGEEPGFIIGEPEFTILPSAIPKEKLSIGKDIGVVMLLMVAVAMASKLPVRVWWLLLLIRHPSSTTVTIVDTRSNERIFRMAESPGAWRTESCQIPPGQTMPYLMADAAMQALLCRAK